MNTALAVFVGGGLGSLARFGVGRWMQFVLPTTFPYGTLMSNILSSLIVGLFIGVSSETIENENPWKFLIAVGFCGGFSTFSTFSAETFELLKNGLYFAGGINIAANLVTCLLMIGVGVWIGKLF